MKYTHTHTHTRQQRTPGNTEIWIAVIFHGVSNTAVKYFKAQWDVTVNNCLASEDHVLSYRGNNFTDEPSASILGAG